MAQLVVFILSIPLQYLFTLVCSRNGIFAEVIFNNNNKMCRITRTLQQLSLQSAYLRDDLEHPLCGGAIISRKHIGQFQFYYRDLLTYFPLKSYRLFHCGFSVKMICGFKQKRQRMKPNATRFKKQYTSFHDLGGFRSQ